MFQEEYRAIFSSGDPTVKDIETRLYMLIREHMDRDTCITGVKRKISYRFFIENTEFLPPVGSREPARRLSKDQVGRLLKSMINRGWIEPMHDTTKHKENIVFKLPLAELGLIRVCEERDMTAIQAPRYKNTSQAPANTKFDKKGAQYDRDTSTATPRYTSLYIDTNVSISNSPEPKDESPVVYELLCSGKKTKPHEVTQNYIDEMQACYPAVNVHQEFLKIKAWLINNPARRKTHNGITKFINTWLSKAQDESGGSNNVRQTNQRTYESPQAKVMRECREYAEQSAIQNSQQTFNGYDHE